MQGTNDNRDPTRQRDDNEDDEIPKEDNRRGKM